MALRLWGSLNVSVLLVFFSTVARMVSFAPEALLVTSSALEPA